MNDSKFFTGLTRAAQLAAAREQFITAHIRPPRFLARANSANRWNLWNFLLLLYWVFFKPSALRLHIARAAPELDEKLSLRQLWSTIQRNAELRGLVQQALLLIFLVPTLIDLNVGLFVVYVRGGTFNWLGSMSGVVGGIVWVITVVIARVGTFGLAWGLTWGISWGVTWGIAGGMAWLIARDMAWDFARSIAWGIAWGIAGSLAWLAASVVAWFIAWIIARGITKVVTTDIVRSISVIFSVLRIPLYMLALFPALGRRAAYAIVALRLPRRVRTGARPVVLMVEPLDSRTHTLHCPHLLQ